MDFDFARRVLRLRIRNGGGIGGPGGRSGAAGVASTIGIEGILFPRRRDRRGLVAAGAGGWAGADATTGLLPSLDRAPALESRRFATSAFLVAVAFAAVFPAAGRAALFAVARAGCLAADWTGLFALVLTGCFAVVLAAFFALVWTGLFVFAAAAFFTLVLPVCFAAGRTAFFTAALPAFFAVALVSLFAGALTVFFDTLFADFATLLPADFLVAVRALPAAAFAPFRVAVGLRTALVADLALLELAAAGVVFFFFAAPALATFTVRFDPAFFCVAGLVCPAPTFFFLCAKTPPPFPIPADDSKQPVVRDGRT